MAPKDAKPESTGSAKGVAIKIIAAWVLLPLFFLATGGSFAWWQAWVYCLILLGPMTVFLVYMARHDPEFIARRTRLREKERTQQRILIWGYPSLIAALVIPGLDHRFGWSAPSGAAVVAAMVIVLGGYLTVLRAFLANRWAGRTVEVFAQQQVVAAGPYAIVRHPMYTGTLALYLATPVALGSWWALVPALAFIPIFVLRIRNEEAVLTRDLPGYAEYRQRVRRRLVPFVW